MVPVSLRAITSYSPMPVSSVNTATASQPSGATAMRAPRWSPVAHRRRSPVLLERAVREVGIARPTGFHVAPTRRLAKASVPERADYHVAVAVRGQIYICVAAAGGDEGIGPPSGWPADGLMAE